MARHNYLIQRNAGGSDGANCNGPVNAKWEDLGSAGHRHTDEFGNSGIATIEEARAQVAHLLSAYPANYRIIQIVS